MLFLLQEVELPLRRASVLALSNIAKHSPELAQVVVDANTLPLIAPLITHPDVRLKRQVSNKINAAFVFSLFLRSTSWCLIHLM